MFARFFKPKWQHRNPAKRIQAVAEMSLDDPALITLAKDDKAPEVRLAVLGRIRDVDVLLEIVDLEQNSRVLMKARSRLRDLLCGNIEGAPPLSKRLQALEKTHGTEIKEHVARHAQEAELRQRALDWIEDPKLLSEITLGDRAIDVRIAAVERLHDLEALERVVKSSRKSDKRVAQLARQRLAELRNRQENNRRSLVLREELEKLCESGNFADRQKGLLKAEREWPALRLSVEKTAVEHFEKILTHLREICDRYRQAKSAKRRACEILEDIILRLKDQEEFTEVLEQRTQEALTDANALWEEQETLEPMDEQSLSRRYRHAAERVIEHQGLLHENSKSAQQIREFLEHTERDAEAGKYTTKKSIVELKDIWDTLPKPRSRELAKQLANRFQQLHDLIEQRRAHAAETAKELQQALTEMVDRLNQAVDEGQLNEAISLRDQIRYRLDNALSLPSGSRTRFEQALKAAAPRIRELQSWRNWGASGVRERLCEQAEGLITQEYSAHDLADRIRELRETWRRLDRQSGPAAEAIWERFNSACNKAYEPCRTAFEEEAKQREHNLDKKNEICNALEKLYQNTDWDQVEWRELVKNYNKLRQSWRRIGPVSRAKGKGVTKRYKKASDKIEAHLDKQRQAGLQLRKQLIERVQKLAEESDLSQAISKTKQAQAEWNRVIVRTSRKSEQGLWKSFRAACDKVFERRNEERQAHREALDAIVEKKTLLVEELEKLMQDPVDEILPQVDSQVERIRHEWTEFGELPKQGYGQLERRFREALESYQRVTDTIKRERAQQLWDALQERGNLCARLEAQLEHMTSSQETETICNAWQALAQLEQDQISGVQARFETALSAMNGDDETQSDVIRSLRENAANKHLQCLQMEVMAGVKSPPEYADQRMRLKVTQLSARFEGQDSKISNSACEAALEMQRLWIASGMLPADEMTALQNRFNAAARVLLRGN